MRKSTVTPTVAAALGLALTVGVTTVFHACAPREDGTWMHCHDCQNTVAATGLVVAALMGASALVKQRALRGTLQALGLLAAVAAFLVPGILCPMCMMRTMRCYTVFQPYTRVVSALAAGTSAVALLGTLRAPKATTPAGGTTTPTPAV